MNNDRRQFLQATAALILTAGAAPDAAWANNYPSQDIRFICAFPAGSGADVIVRYFAEKVRAAGLEIVMDHCPAIEYPRLVGGSKEH